MRGSIQQNPRRSTVLNERLEDVSDNLRIPPNPRRELAVAPGTRSTFPKGIVRFGLQKLAVHQRPNILASNFYGLSAFQ
jgi:hypothetical protein